MKAFLLGLICFLTLSSAKAANIPQIYIFLGGDSVANSIHLLDLPKIAGVQIIYSWRRLETKKDVYDFSSIHKDLKLVKSKNKALFIQIQDRSFLPHVINVPQYLLKEEIYKGGIEKQGDFPGEGLPSSYGWVAKQWIPSVNKRFHKLLKALAKEFDGLITGMNLPETSVHLDPNNMPKDFKCKDYFNSVIANMKIMKESFKKSYAVQYVNFFPCEWNNDHKYMERTFQLAQEKNIGLGNPDTVPFRKGQMKNSYPFFKQYNDKIQVTAIAIQEPDYTYKNPRTNKPFTMKELFDFSRDYLGSDIIFWNRQEPQFTKEVIPFLNTL